MKDMIKDAIAKKLSTTMESIGGANALYGDPVTFNGEEIIPVARVTVVLGADAVGSGGGNAGLSSLTNRAKGSGGGDAEASVRVNIEPVGFLKSTPNGPVFCAISEASS